MESGQAEVRRRESREGSSVGLENSRVSENATPLGYLVGDKIKVPLSAQRPRLTPLIHLSMSPTAAPNNTPVESTMNSAHVSLGSAEKNEGHTSSALDGKVLPPLRSEKIINAAKHHVIDIKDVDAGKTLGGEAKIDGAMSMEQTQTPISLLHVGSQRSDSEVVVDERGVGSVLGCGQGNKPEGLRLESRVRRVDMGGSGGDDHAGLLNHESMWLPTSRDLHMSGSAMTPKRLHFDCSTEKMDPGAGISSISTQKINIISLLNSKSNADSISPPPSTAGVDSVIQFPPSSASNNFSSGSFLQPRIQNTQLPSSLTPIVSSSLKLDDNASGRRIGSVISTNGNGNGMLSATYQPKFFNTKFDELRNRVLLGSSNPPKLESHSSSAGATHTLAHEQEGNVDAEAAAIISQMRSSPLPPFSEHISSAGNETRPSSSLSVQSVQNNNSSFTKRILPKPVIRVNQREHSASQDEHAIIEEDEEYITNKSSSQDNSPSETVAWNKNGNRRLSRRRSGPPHYNLSKPGVDKSANASIDSLYTAAEIVENKDRWKRSRSSSLSAEPTSSLSPTFKRVKKLKFKESNYNNESSNEQISKSRDQIKKRNATGARSRTGCWICRLRKKKCTEEKPQCQNCVRLHLECVYDIVKPDFISDPVKKAAKLEEIKKKTKEAKRQAMKKKSWL